MICKAVVVSRERVDSSFMAVFVYGENCSAWHFFFFYCFMTSFFRGKLRVVVWIHCSLNSADFTSELHTEVILTWFPQTSLPVNPSTNGATHVVIPERADYVLPRISRSGLPANTAGCCPPSSSSLNFWRGSFPHTNSLSRKLVITLMER